MTRPIVSQKTSVAGAEGGLSKSFGIGQLCSASVIVCKNLVYDNVYEFSTEKKKWSLVKKLDFGIYSHSTVCWKGFLIINGGLKDFSKCQVNRDLILIQPAPFGSSLRQVPNLPDHYFGRFAHTSHITGKSLSEALILASINPKYDHRLFIELQVQ